MTRPLTTSQLRSFRRTVRSYYAKHRRDLSWRRTDDPYCIYVSEIMLQQTQVDRVAAKYASFTRRFPSWESLARAGLDEVLSEWQGLGYNRRAKFLHQAAAEIVEHRGGVLPDSPEHLRELPGIGTATAASIAAFAFDCPTVFIETNIRSVFIHHFFPGRGDVSDQEILPLVRQTLDRRHPGQWYSALMDYGTSLKKAMPNPSRRSRHHVRQSPFEGSTRQVRGRILKLLLDEPGLTARSLTSRVDDPENRTGEILKALVREGMVVCEGRRHRITGKGAQRST